MPVSCVEADATAGGILLPQRSSPAKRKTVPAVQPDAGAGTARRRVLIVDDEWLISAQIEHILTTAGFEIVGTAPDAASAIALADQERPDLVLMDIRLQGPVDGVDAARDIVDRFGIRSLFVSAHADQGTITRTLAARPLGWLPKPFTQAELLQAVRTALTST
jgi:DNA-binding NarL/FixJ family response regulator